MANLFIIGNGFDIAHKLKTKYNDFNIYLSKKYPSANGEELHLPNCQMDPDGGESYDDTEIADFIKCLINLAENGNEWNQLEESVGKLEYNYCLDDVIEVYDREGDIDLFKTSHNFEDASLQLVYPFQSITRFFEDWINTIYISKWRKKIPDFNCLIDKENDYFLTFNYTDTLELIYKVKNVCHIHGRQGEYLYFGHGTDFDFYEDGDYPIGSESYLQSIHNSLKKDTLSALRLHQEFFNNISGIKNIYSYGFSFANVDLIYIEEICKQINTKNITWYLNDFDDVSKRQVFMDRIVSCGFKGGIVSYHIHNPYFE